MQTVDSARALARELNTTLCVIWVRNADCNSRFRDLFDRTAFPHRVIELRDGTLSNLINRYANPIFCRFNNLYLGEKKTARLQENPKNVQALSKHRHIYLHTYSRFFSSPAILHFAAFTPRKNLLQIIRQHRTENCIGIHIRRTDNRHAIAQSPLNAFIRQMRTELRNDPAVTFFLATDDPTIEQQLQTEFPGKINRYKKRTLDRNRAEAIQDAVIDLFALAQCRKLIGSHWSSFSSTAAEINNIEQLIIREPAPAKASF
jgi:hypothetical protein